MFGHISADGLLYVEPVCLPLHPQLVPVMIPKGGQAVAVHAVLNEGGLKQRECRGLVCGLEY